MGDVEDITTELVLRMRLGDAAVRLDVEQLRAIVEAAERMAAGPSIAKAREGAPRW